MPKRSRHAGKDPNGSVAVVCEQLRDVTGSPGVLQLQAAQPRGIICGCMCVYGKKNSSPEQPAAKNGSKQRQSRAVITSMSVYSCISVCCQYTRTHTNHPLSSSHHNACVLTSVFMTQQ